MYVEEKNRSWCSFSNANDQRAVTIECASETTEPYEMYDVVYQTLIIPCTDICKRNGKKKLLWLKDKDKILNQENSQTKFHYKLNSPQEISFSNFGVWITSCGAT